MCSRALARPCFQVAFVCTLVARGLVIIIAVVGAQISAGCDTSGAGNVTGAYEIDPCPPTYSMVAGGSDSIRVVLRNEDGEAQGVDIVAFRQLQNWLTASWASDRPPTHTHSISHS